MTKKFLKRVLNSPNFTGNVLVIGDGFEYLKDLIDNCLSVFIVPFGEISFRERNLIFRESLEDIDKISPISFIFINFDQYTCIKKLDKLINLYKPDIFISGQHLIPIEEVRFLQDRRYSVMSIEKNYYRWAFKK